MLKDSPKANEKSDIVLIGPVRTGKSTIARLLSAKLGLPQVSLDDVRWQYYREIGYDDALAKTIRQQGGFLAWFFIGSFLVPMQLSGFYLTITTAFLILGLGRVLLKAKKVSYGFNEL